MKIFSLLFILMTLCAFARSAIAGDPSVMVAGGDTFSRILESSTVGATFAGAVILTARWLLVQLISTKDKEIEGKEKENERLRAESAKLLERQQDTLVALRDVTLALQRLNDTLNRMEYPGGRHTSLPEVRPPDIGDKA